MAENMGKHPKAVQNPSTVRISPKVATYIKIPSFLPYYSQNSLPKYSSVSSIHIPEFIVFLLKLNCGFPKKIKQKKNIFFSLDLHTFCQKRTFCYLTTFFESAITHKRFIFKDSYISNGKRQKSCTLIVIWVKCLYLTSPTFNSSAKSNRIFLL